MAYVQRSTDRPYYLPMMHKKEFTKLLAKHGLSVPNISMTGNQARFTKEEIDRFPRYLRRGGEYGHFLCDRKPKQPRWLPPDRYGDIPDGWVLKEFVVYNDKGRAQTVYRAAPLHSKDGELGCRTPGAVYDFDQHKYVLKGDLRSALCAVSSL